jgi:anti-sigma regulatory factor (Ser/Thr protein kinase)
VHQIMDAVLMTLPAAPGSAMTARSEVTRRLAKLVTGGVLEDIRLLLTELITNALRHGAVSSDDEIGVKAEVTEGTVRLEVHDPGRNGVVAAREPGERGGGYGLYLVECLTDEWGVDQRDGTRVWAELSAGLAR